MANDALAQTLAQLSIATTATTSFTNLLLVSPQQTVGYQPQTPPPSADGLPSFLTKPKPFLFHYEGEQSVTTECDITDHYVEDNTAIQDHITLRPETITTHGFIGELNDVPPALLAVVKAAAQRLTALTAYTPQLTQTALYAYSQAFFLYQVGAGVVNAAGAAVATIGNLVTGSNGQSVIGSSGLIAAGSQNLQQTAYQQFYLYQRARVLFTVQTPWAVFQNMAIKSLRAVQDGESSEISDFEITFKMIRTASTLGPQAGLSFSGRLGTQASGLTDLGTSSPAASTSLSDGLSAMGVA